MNGEYDDEETRTMKTNYTKNRIILKQHISDITDGHREERKINTTDNKWKETMSKERKKGRLKGIIKNSKILQSKLRTKMGIQPCTKSK